MSTVTKDISGAEISGDADTAGTYNTEAFQVQFTLEGSGRNDADLNQYVAVVDADNGNAIVRHTYNQNEPLGASQTHNWDEDSGNLTVSHTP